MSQPSSDKPALTAAAHQLIHEVETASLGEQASDNPYLDDMRQLWQDLDLLDEQQLHELQELHELTGETTPTALPSETETVGATTTNTTTVDTITIAANASPATSRSWWQYGAAGLCSLLLVALASYAGISYQGQAQYYSVAKGEQHTVTLNDGSTVLLDSNSEVIVHESWGRRDVELLHGNAFFTVAKHPFKPFRVMLGATTVSVLGTAFNIRHLAGKTAITVTNGSVKVTNDQVTQSVDQILAARDRLSLQDNQATLQHNTDVQQVLAWREHQLYFEDEPLESVIIRFNQYQQRPIRLLNQQLKSLKVNGNFDSRDVTALLSALTAITPLQIDQSDPSEIILR